MFEHMIVNAIRYTKKTVDMTLLLKLIESVAPQEHEIVHQPKSYILPDHPAVNWILDQSHIKSMSKIAEKKWERELVHPC